MVSCDSTSICRESMRRHSSMSDGLLAPLFTSPRVEAQLTDEALLQAMLDVEAALAKAGADIGVVPAAAADAIAAACRADGFSIAEIGAAAEASGNPVVPLVQALAGGGRRTDRAMGALRCDESRRRRHRTDAARRAGRRTVGAVRPCCRRCVRRTCRPAPRHGRRWPERSASRPCRRRSVSRRRPGCRGSTPPVTAWTT